MGAVSLAIANSCFQIHIVHFDANQKIQSIRLNWDQGSLLKQVDVIGARARAWPIRDGKDQTRLIASSAATVPQSNNGFSKNGTSNSQARETSPSRESRSRKNTNATRDPHSSHLFAPRDEADDESSPRPAATGQRGSARPPPRDYGDLFAGEDNEPPRPVSPQKENRPLPKAQTAKPPPRDYHDLFVGHESDASPASKEKLNSPLKNITSPIPTAPKGGAGKNFQPMRLFENGNSEASSTSQKHNPLKPQSQRYGHFELGDRDEEGQGEQQALPGKAKTKGHQSQWDFEDFMTPEKVRTKARPNETRHFALNEDESVRDSPVKNASKVNQPRPDANAQFELQDDGAGAGERRPAGQPKGNVHAHSMGLYQNNVLDEEAAGQNTEMGKKNHPLATVTNLQQRGKVFEHQFNIQDQPSSPAPNNNDAKKVPENRNKVVKTMESQWEAADMSPAPAGERKGKENFPTAAGAKNIGIKSDGDGMGGKKGAERGWGFGDDSGGEDAMKKKKFLPGKAQHAGGDRSWNFGDESDEGPDGTVSKKFQPERKQHAQGRSEGWSF